jgi:hypothetical protein
MRIGKKKKKRRSPKRILTPEEVPERFIVPEKVPDRVPVPVEVPLAPSREVNTGGS